MSKSASFYSKNRKKERRRSSKLYKLLTDAIRSPNLLASDQNNIPSNSLLSPYYHQNSKNSFPNAEQQKLIQQRQKRLQTLHKYLQSTTPRRHSHTSSKNSIQLPQPQDQSDSISAKSLNISVDKVTELRDENENLIKDPSAGQTIKEV